jgi:hypothetical protein
MTLKKNGRRPQKKMEDDLKKKKEGRQPKKKMEDEPINQNQPN